MCGLISMSHKCVSNIPGTCHKIYAEFRLELQSKVSKVPFLCQSVLSNSRGKWLFVLSPGYLPSLRKTLIYALHVHVQVTLFITIQLCNSRYLSNISSCTRFQRAYLHIFYIFYVSPQVNSYNCSEVYHLINCKFWVTARHVHFHVQCTWTRVFYWLAVSLRQFQLEAKQNR